MICKIKAWNYKIGLYVLASVAGAGAFALFLYYYAMCPDSVILDTDIFGHFFKINYLRDSIENGVLYPVYSEYWYNSIELFRYWPPLSYYAVVLTQFLTGLDVLDVFYVFIGGVYLLNMLGWFLIGKKEQRLGMAFLVGNLFFFCPDNMRIFLAEGNIPRIFIIALLPYVFHYTWEILHYNNYKKLLHLAIVTWIVTLSHYMIAAMVGISIFLFASIYCAMKKRFWELIWITMDLAFSYMTMGVFLLPGLLGGGLTSQSSEASVATIGQWAQEAVKSLNPFFRVTDGGISSFYFGLAIFVIALLGCIAANKKMGAGFITTIFIFLCTTTTASTVVRLLPMSQVFWMQRFVPMAMCLFFLSLLVWKNLKKTALVFFTIIMLADSLGQAVLLIEEKDQTIHEVVKDEVEDYLLPEAKALTKNRLGVLDYSLRGSIPSWYLMDGMDENNVAYSFGWAYQGAETIENIVCINEAAEGRFYEYAFDRILELGDDVVLVDKKQFPKEDADAILEAAAQVGYSLYKENEEAWLFYLENVDGTFGIVKEYDCLSIGSNAREICYLYPRFGWGKSDILEDYALEELAQYDKIYLSGFSYKDKAAAEKLLSDVADLGVEIYIDMQHIPMNKLSGKAEFMGVYAQFVAFTEKFPVLSTNNGSQFKLDFKTAGYEVWNTVYLTGASEEVKRAYYDDATSLTYVAKNGNPNITFLGLNPVYYYHESKIPELLTFLNEVFEETPGTICESKIVPIDIDYGNDYVSIRSDYDSVNTGVANLDCFIMDDGSLKEEESNLLVVNKGNTFFEVKYSHFELGLVVSVIGISMSIVFWIVLGKRKREENK